MCDRTWEKGYQKLMLSQLDLVWRVAIYLILEEVDILLTELYYSINVVLAIPCIKLEHWVGRVDYIVKEFLFKVKGGQAH